MHHYLTEAIDAVLAGRRRRDRDDPGRGLPDRAQGPQAGRPVAGPPRLRPRVRRRCWTNEPPVPSTRDRQGGDLRRAMSRRSCTLAARRATGQGQVAPFSLLTYDQAHRWAASIAEVIADNRMPPWHADPRYGHFANDRSLTPANARS